MRSKLVITAVLLATITVGCTTVVSKPQQSSKDQVDQLPIMEHQPVKPPATPRNGVRVTEESLPTELSGWKNVTPDLPGGISAVVGNSLYVLASPGRIGDDTYEMTIADVAVVDKRVQVEAYLTRTKADGTQGRYCPKGYAKTPYTGSAKELPVDLKIVYGDAAYAYVKEKPFDHVDGQLLPTQLHAWLSAGVTTNQNAQAAVVGDYLYVMVHAGEQQKGVWLRFQDVELNGSEVNVEVTYEKVNGQADWSPYISPIFARIPYQGAAVPRVKVAYKEYHRPQ